MTRQVWMRRREAGFQRNQGQHATTEMTFEGIYALDLGVLFTGEGTPAVVAGVRPLAGPELQ